MKIGFSLPNLGPLTTPDALKTIAQTAERLGYHSLWTADRLLFPVRPRTPYPGTPDGRLPEAMRRNMDPLEALTFAAAHTSKITLGTSVLVMPFYNPVVLARRVATLDVLSGGRARICLGLGWSADEYAAAREPQEQMGAKADEYLQVLKAVWTQDPASFSGKHYTLPASHFDLKPVQKPHPPIYLASYNRAGLRRAALLADGWNPAGIPVDGMKQMMAGMRATAKQSGRDPDELAVVVRANVYVSKKPLGADRHIFSGTLDQIRQDAEACAKLGVDEVFLDPSFGPDGTSLEWYLQRLDELKP